MKSLLKTVKEFFQDIAKAKQAADLARGGHWDKAQQLYK